MASKYCMLHGMLISLVSISQLSAAEPAPSAQFVVLDRNRDGVLNYTEFVTDAGDALVLQHWLFFESDLNDDDQVTEAEYVGWTGGRSRGPARDFLRRDVDRSGTVALKEFLQWAPEAAVASNKRNFRLVDFDGNDLLSPDEFRALPAGPLSDRGPAPAASDVAATARHDRVRQYRDQWFATADANHDAVVTKEEFAGVGSGYFPAVFEMFVNLDQSGAGTLSYADYVRPTLGSQWEAAANDEARRFDVDDDGGISWLEFQITPRAVPTLEQWFAGLDSNRDGKLSLNEYLHTFVDAQRPGSRRTYYRFDRDGDGTLNRDEWLRQGQGPIATASEFRCRDGDGELTMDEFVVFADPQWHAHYKRNFRLVDQDSNARLSLDEFRCVPGMGRHEDRNGLKDPVVGWMEKQLESVMAAFRRKDSDGDGRLSSREWPTAEIKDVSADLGAISPSIWDRNHDGFISTDECRTTLEVVFGIVLENGSRLHLKNGHVVNLGMFRQFDTNNDDKLSRHEFVSRFWKSP